jgi:hypothetical protein
MRHFKLGYPFLFAVVPIMNTLTRNPGGSRLADIGVVIGAVLLGCAVLYLLTAVALRGKLPAAAIPLIVLAAILWCYGKPVLSSWARQVGGGAPGVIFLAVLLALNGVVVWWLSQRPRYLEQTNRFFSVTGLIMAAWLGFRFGRDQIRARSEVRHSALARELAQPVGSAHFSAHTSSESLRDIYLIVLDEYANSSVLKERFQFDNRAFEDSLGRLGFTIPAVVRSNYVHTLLSLPSLLNFSHLTRLKAEVGPRSTDATLPNYLLENNRTTAFLKARGYQFLFFPSRWWPSTEHNANADWEFQAWNGFNVGREATSSDLRRSLLRSTALGLFAREDAWDAEHVRRTLGGLEQVPERAEPTFAFAHVVSPHWPYVFRGDCRTVTREPARTKGWRERAYTEQLQCLNRLVLGTVTTILERSSVPPIILLQGDHGTNLLRYSSAKTARAVSPDQARERFGAFGAYYLPAGGARLFADTVTIVNVVQKVLKHYFDAEIPPAPDDLYMSLERSPYDFVQMNPVTLTAPASSTNAIAHRPAMDSTR